MDRDWNWVTGELAPLRVKWPCEKMVCRGCRICVVLVIDDLEYGGAQQQVVELAKNMDPGYFDVHACTLPNYVPLGRQLRDGRETAYSSRGEQSGFYNRATAGTVTCSVLQPKWLFRVADSQ
jgi:hypothetical protein